MIMKELIYVVFLISLRTAFSCVAYLIQELCARM